MHRAALLTLCSLLPGAAVAPPPLVHGAYVWQRDRGASVGEAVEQAPRALASLVWLAAELDPRARPSTVLLPLEGARGAGRPVGLALRVHTPSRAALTASSPPDELVTALDQVLARARAARVSPVEVQLDLDCPTHALATYAAWLPTLAARTGEVPLTITALPAWLGSPGFEQLARASAGFVLQVHSLELTATAARRARLFDGAASRAAVARAARVGVPFRVALPTHGYQLGLDGARGLVDVRAEDGDVIEDARVATDEVQADPAELAGFVRWLARARPPELIGVEWFRLPTRDDRRSVTMAGLTRLMAGDAPSPRLRGVARRDDDGAVAIELSNDGDAPSRAATVEVRFRRGSLAAFDATGARAAAEDARVVFETAGLGPGATRSLGWVRLDDGGEVRVDAR